MDIWVVSGWEIFLTMQRTLLNLSFGEHTYRILLGIYLVHTVCIFSDLVDPLLGTRYFNRCLFSISLPASRMLLLHLTSAHNKPHLASLKSTNVGCFKTFYDLGMLYLKCYFMQGLHSLALSNHLFIQQTMFPALRPCTSLGTY